MNPANLAAVLAASLVPLSLPGAAPRAATAPPPGIRWSQSYAGALAEARESGRPVLVAVVASWCPYSRRMDRESFPDRRVIALAGEFHCVRLNSESGEGKALIRRWGLEAVPTLVLLDSTGRELRRLEGFHSPEEMAAALRMTAAPGVRELGSFRALDVFIPDDRRIGPWLRFQVPGEARRSHLTRVQGS